MSKKSRETTSQRRATAEQRDDELAAALREKRGEAPLVTVERFVRTVKDRELGEAFLSCEKLRTVRRLTADDWQNEYNAWLTMPRG
jgi:hypothetical protein